MSLIALRNICRVFQVGEEKVHALRSLNLEIQNGEYVSIQGTSGSGKSTLLYILGLLDKASAGSYLYDKVEVTKLSEVEAANLRNDSIGFVFQSFHLLGRASALANVMMPLFYRRIAPALSRKEIRERAESMLEKVGLKERLNHLPNELSGGQKQRVAIARALVTEPRLVLADEPTGNLDSRTSRDVMNLIEQVHDAGVTIVIITHDREVALRAERHIKLEDGEVVEDSGNANI